MVVVVAVAQQLPQPSLQSPLLAQQRQQARAFLESKSGELSLGNEYRVGRLTIFEVSGAHGFIVGSDEGIIGYCDHGRYDEDQLPEGLRWWLHEFAGERDTTGVPALSGGQATSTASALATEEERQAVAPMLTTRWGQQAPYNQQCPAVEGRNAPTGCVATAMAQVMAYYRYPLAATTAVPAYTTRTLQLMLPALEPTVFQWQQMSDTYGSNSTEAQRESVASLMRYAGQSVGMDYQTTVSGAYLAEAAAALRNNFGYDGDMQHVAAAHYTAAQWEQLIYNEVASGRPVIMAGHTRSGSAHAFVCDGCDADGLFHINWGWAGNYDGYYRLTRLNPQNTSYATHCDAVVGIQPPDGHDSPAPPRRLVGRELTVNGLTIGAQLLNLNTDGGYYDFGFAEQQEDGTLGFVYNQRTLEFQAKKGWNIKSDVAMYGLGRGTHRLVPVCRLTGTDAWLMLFNEETFIEARMQSDTEGRLLLSPGTTIDVPDLAAELTGVEGPCYAQCEVQVRVRLKTSSHDFSGMVYLWPGGRRRVGVGPVTIAAGDSTELAGHVRFDSDGLQTLYVTADEEMEYIIGSGTVSVAPFVETEGLLALTQPLTLSADGLLTLRLRNEASTDYVGYLFVSVSRFDETQNLWQPCGNVDTLVVLAPSVPATTLTLALPLPSPTARYALEVSCQDFGNYTPYGSTHTLTTEPQQIDLGEAVAVQPAMAGRRSAAGHWTLGGRRATKNSRTVTVGRGRKFIPAIVP